MSGQHIKTINGVNIVGHGNVDFYVNENLIGVDSSFDASSNNAIMNSTITKELDNLKDYIKDQDSSLENYINKQDSSITDVITWENISKQ